MFRDGGSWAMYSDSSLIIEHRFHTVTESQRHSLRQSTGDDDVTGVQLSTLFGQLCDEPGDADRRMA